MTSTHHPTPVRRGAMQAQQCLHGNLHCKHMDLRPEPSTQSLFRVFSITDWFGKRGNFSLDGGFPYGFMLHMAYFF